MKYLWFYFFCGSLAIERGDKRILDGEDAKVVEFPYVVAIVAKDSRCTGSLIAPDWVLTAAHCLGSDMKVFAGHPHRSEAQMRVVKEIIHHPKYIPDLTGFYDLALLQVEKFQMDSVNIGILELSGEEWPQKFQLNVSCSAVGYGLANTTSVKAVDELQKVKLTARHGEDSCYCTKQSFVVKKLVCMEPQEQHGVCLGDSGGPLVCNGKGVGVAHMLIDRRSCQRWSFEVIKLECGTKNSVGVYMYLCPVLDWIRQYVNNVPQTPLSCDASNFHYGNSYYIFVISIYLILVKYIV